MAEQAQDKAAQQAADAAAADVADSGTGGVPTEAERRQMDAQRIPSTDGGPAPEEPTSAEDSSGLMAQ